MHYTPCFFLCFFLGAARAFMYPPAVATRSGRSREGLQPRFLGEEGAPLDRKSFLCVIAATVVTLGSAQPSYSAASVNKEQGQQAYNSLRQVRKELDAGDSLFLNKDWEGAEEFFAKPNIAQLEKTLTLLINSNVLPREDKIAVGTIRRYGLAADSLIMLGGSAAAVPNEDAKEGLRLLKLGKNSLDEILAICKSSGALEK